MNKRELGKYGEEKAIEYLEKRVTKSLPGITGLAGVKLI